MIFGNGIDIIEIDRIKTLIEKKPRFLNKYFTDIENEYFKSKVRYWESVAGYFAAKEAVSKALGTGLDFITLKDIEIIKDDNNKPYVHLHRQGYKYITENSIEKIHITISHSKEYAIAYAIATIL